MFWSLQADRRAVRLLAIAVKPIILDGPVSRSSVRPVGPKTWCLEANSCPYLVSNVCVRADGLVPRPLYCTRLLLTTELNGRTSVGRSVFVLSECGNKDELSRQVLSYLVATVESQ